MSKARELLNGKEGEQHTLSSGVTVRVLPFPAGLWASLNTKAMEDFPEPEPPKKTIKVVDGTEEIDDLDNQDYLDEREYIKRARNSMLGEAIIDLSIQLDLGEWEPTIKRLEKYSGKYPDDLDDRRIKFLTEYALRTRGDYEVVMVSATTQMMISDPEVANRLKSFRGEMERAIITDINASGVNETERMEV